MRHFKARGTRPNEGRRDQPVDKVFFPAVATAEGDDRVARAAVYVRH
jgi:hypothetical protein